MARMNVVSLVGLFLFSVASRNVVGMDCKNNPEMHKMIFKNNLCYDIKLSTESDSDELSWTVKRMTGDIIEVACGSKIYVVIEDALYSQSKASYFEVSSKIGFIITNFIDTKGCARLIRGGYDCPVTAAEYIHENATFAIDVWLNKGKGIRSQKLFYSERSNEKKRKKGLMCLPRNAEVYLCKSDEPSIRSSVFSINTKIESISIKLRNRRLMLTPSYAPDTVTNQCSSPKENRTFTGWTTASPYNSASPEDNRDSSIPSKDVFAKQRDLQNYMRWAQERNWNEVRRMKVKNKEVSNESCRSD